MVNLEKMLRQLMDSQQQRAQGRQPQVEDEVVELGMSSVVQTPPDLEPTPVRESLSERHLQSALSEEANPDRHVGRLEQEDAATQLGHGSHRLGQLDHEDLSEQLGITTSPLSRSLAAEIASMMKTPRGMAQAVLLAEIINRPTDRW
jgi:hypothetical protein